MKEKFRLTKMAELLKQYPGKYYLENEQAWLNNVLPSMHGFYLVQLGAIESYDLQAADAITEHFVIGTREESYESLQAISNLIELPLQAESVDVFLLPHTLEFVVSPEKLLSEIYHCLIPGGKIILLGFNAVSLLGLSRLVPSKENFPWSGRLYRSGYIKRLLSSLNFSLSDQKSFGFLPPFLHKNVGKKSQEGLVRQIFSGIGNSYLLVAEKKVAAPLALVKLKIGKERRLARGFPAPSTNKSL